MEYNSKCMKYSIVFKIPGKEDVLFSSPPGMTLLEASRKAGLDLEAPCSGNGTCHKCLVRVEENTVLACQTKIDRDLTVSMSASKTAIKILDFRNEREHKIFSSLKNDLVSLGYTEGSSDQSPSDQDPIEHYPIELIPLKLENPEIDDSMADRERLLQSLAEDLSPETKAAGDICLHALRKLPKVLRQGGFSCTCVINRGKGLRVMDVFPESDGSRPLLPGLAIDIGTTTVAAILVDLQSGGLLASSSRINPQVRFGGDVINRIIESIRPGGLERLRRVLFDDCLIPLIQELAAKAGIEPSQIYRAAIAANTTMTHLFVGVSPEFLRLEPYVPAFFQTNSLAASSLELPIHPDAEVLIAPSVGSYVGGDISAGIFASMIFRKEAHSLFIDLGTNGELVFGGREFLLACACSAGPAFEGGDISCGMRAADGAIDSVRIDRVTLEPNLTVISDAQESVTHKPAGICGSGLIELVAELFESRCIDSKGKFIFPLEDTQKSNPLHVQRLARDEWGMARYTLVFGAETETGKDIFITEGDIDNFIRAKGAIFSAIRTMLAILDFNQGDIDEVYIAGGIGSGINIDKAIRIGMLPNIPGERFHYIGNASLSGAYSMVLSQKAARKIEEIAGNITYLELSSHHSYMDEFVSACFLPHTKNELFSKPVTGGPQ
jgi:uncharacterized 2Fe-2S/4Fe-4S cluster protein (DUF4445 family)